MRHTYRPFSEIEAVEAVINGMTPDDVRCLGEIAQSRRAKPDPETWLKNTLALIDARSQAYFEAIAAGDKLSWWRRWRDYDQIAAFASLLRRAAILSYDKPELGTAENDEALGWKLSAHDTMHEVLESIELRPWLSEADFDALMGSWGEFMRSRQPR